MAILYCVKHWWMQQLAHKTPQLFQHSLIHVCLAFSVESVVCAALLYCPLIVIRYSVEFFFLCPFVSCASFECGDDDVGRAHATRTKNSIGVVSDAKSINKRCVLGASWAFVCTLYCTSYTYHVHLARLQKCCTNIFRRLLMSYAILFTYDEPKIIIIKRIKWPSEYNFVTFSTFSFPIVDIASSRNIYFFFICLRSILYLSCWYIRAHSTVNRTMDKWRGGKNSNQSCAIRP